MAARCGALWGLYHLGARTLHAAFLPHARALAEIAATAGVPDFKAVLETCAVTAARLIEEAWRIGPSGGQPPVAKAPAEPSAWDAALAAASRVEPGSDAAADGAALGVLRELFDMKQLDSGGVY